MTNKALHQKFMDLSIIILSFNTRKILVSCLESIFKHTKNISYEVIVVDNASIDDSVSHVKSHFPKVKLIKNKDNLGFSGGNNVGIKNAKGRYILFLNSDTQVVENALFDLVKFLDKNKNVGAIGPKLINNDGSIQPSAGKFPTLPVVFLMLFQEHFGGNQLVRGSFDNLREVDWVMGAALMVRHDVLEKVGLFDEEIFMYYDEVELCYRIKKAGFPIYYYPKPEIVHLWQKSSSTGRRGPILANFKSLIYFYQKHRSFLALFTLRIMLKLKSILALTLGYIKNDSYLKETYAEAFKLV